MFGISNYLLKNSKSSFFIILSPLRIMKNDIFNKMLPSEALEMFEESLEPFLRNGDELKVFYKIIKKKLDKSFCYVKLE